MTDNKLVKTILDAAALTVLSAGLDWASKKIVKENLTADPSGSAMNYVKFTIVMSAAITLKQHLDDQKTLPQNV